MKEEDIRKRDRLARYLELVREDCARSFGDGIGLSPVACPACESLDAGFEFAKDGFEYATCRSCETLYARTRPSFDRLKSFYAESAATTYWINEFFAPVADARREKVFRPRAEYVVSTFGQDPKWVIGDIGAGFGLFSQELRNLWPLSRYIAIEPSLEQADRCRNAGLDVLSSSLEEVAVLGSHDGRFDLLTAFELIEHLHDPRVFLRAVQRLLKPGGWLLMTTLNGQGFDIQLLWERSHSIYPPCHINFFNPVSMTRLISSVGFDVKDVSTPGQLDWSIVEGMMEREGVSPGRFWDVLAKKVSPASKHDLQSWLQRHLLSSHMRVLARRSSP